MGVVQVIPETAGLAGCGIENCPGTLTIKWFVGGYFSVLERGSQAEALLDLSGGVFVAEEGLIEVVDASVEGAGHRLNAGVEGATH